MSSLEAMSISMIEALRLAKPVVLMKNGIFEEFIEDGVEGFLVESNVEAFNRILELLKNKDLYCQMSNAAHVKSKLFTIEKCVLETENWYEHVLINKHEILNKRQLHFNELLKEYYSLLSKPTKV
jgi:glycosyltransferase involved in cell wall biosynthesis